MIKLTNVTKTYVTKSKQNVDALRGVNFELGNTGMVFILGKSGSGKSTLLNLLGGLDKPTNGDIVVDGVSTKDFKQADYDSYRSGYVGFVFQEYNLLDDFNVKENVALALQLTKGNDIDSKVVNALEQVELSANYLTRRVGELSGGEKQRVAIARSIVKDGHVILADEPTGNLDSATGESIWNILKNLSKDKLVVVVSHDRESAQKYADRVIEIADGRVIADSGEQQIEHATNQSFSTQKNRLSFKACIKMAFNNMRQRKIRAICTILLAVATTMALLVTQIILSYTPEDTIARFIEQNGVEYVTVAPRKNANDTDSTSNINWYSTARLKQKALDYITENSTCMVSNYVDSKQDILDMGLSFVGEAMELVPNSYYITQSYYEGVLSWYGSYVIIDGQKIDIRELEYTSVDFFVGKKVILCNQRSYYFLDANNISIDEYPTLCGVIDTDNLSDLGKYSIPEIFVSRDINCSKVTITRDNDFNDTSKDITIEFGKYTYSEKFTTKVGSMLSYPYCKNALLTVDGLEIKESISPPENEREIYLTYDLYLQFFGGDILDYVDINLTRVVRMPEALGKAYPMKFYDYESGDLVGDAGEFTVAGIIFSTDPNFSNSNNANTILISKIARVILDQAIGLDKPVVIKTDSVKNMAKLLKTLRYKYAVTAVRIGRIPDPNGTFAATHNSYTQLFYEFENNVRTLQRIFVIICAALVVALVLMVINMISFSITNRKREIGILSALGTSNKDITVIFIMETLFIAVLCFVLGLIAILIAQPVINIKYSEEYLYVLPYFNVDIVTVAVLFGASFGLLLLATLIPIRKIAKLKPIDAIRNT